MAGEGADGDRAPPILGMVSLFAAGEECIQVHVGDRAMFLSGACHVLLYEVPEDPFMVIELQSGHLDSYSNTIKYHTASKL
jgi:hypothetical protein